MEYYITIEDYPGWMLSGVGIGNNINIDTLQSLNWTKNKRAAIKFSKEEAEETIKFIINVIDYRLEGYLIILKA